MATITKSGTIIYPLSTDEKLKLCQEWQKTGLSRSAFMRERNLPPVFNHWCNKFLPKPQPTKINPIDPVIEKRSDWLEVKPTNSVLSELKPADPQLMEFGLTCHDLQLNFCMPMGQVINFIKELCDATRFRRKNGAKV